MSDTPRSSKHSSRTPRDGGSSGSGSGSDGRGKRTWIGGTGSSESSESDTAAGTGSKASGAKSSSKASSAKASSSKPSSAKPTSKPSSAKSGTAASASGSAKGSTKSSSNGSAKAGAASVGAAAAARGTKRDKAAKKASAPRRAGFWGGVAGALNYPRAKGRGPLRWFPSLRMIFGALALVILVGAGAFAYLYSTIGVPEPDDIALAQTSRVYFSDNATEMGTFSEVNRTIIPNDEIPETVKNAVVASEDSTFYENRGVSPRGIVRALWNNLRGGARQGGSTITQQYVERYYTGTNTSYTGKVKEMIMALKIDQELPKDEILSRYLNTIYFGRGAYGIQAAAQAYYGKDAKDLTDGEAAVLVGLIPAPSAYDPAVSPEKSQTRWKRVIEREVDITKVLTPAQADAIEYPMPQEPTSRNTFSGTNGYLLRMVQDELDKKGIDADDLNRGGYHIVSTFDTNIQALAVQAVDDLPDDRPENNRVGTVTMDPSTGAVRALYGGPDYLSQQLNSASGAHMQAGSIFKTFTLLAAIQDGYSLNSMWDGDSPKNIKGWKVNNFSNASYGQISLLKATTNSVNTAYGQLNFEMGPAKTREMAITMGLPEKTPGLDDDVTNVLGTASPTVLNMASAYSTIAAQGVHRTPYVVQTVTRPDGSVAYEHQDDATQVIDKGVAINATVALQGPPSDGSARYVGRNMSGRPVAGKTGTSESFRSAWFVGFTPQLVTAVGMFQPSADGTTEEPLTPFGGVKDMTGGTFPTQIWVGIMKPALQGQEKLDFPSAVRIKGAKKGRTATTTKARTTTKAPATTPPTTEAPTTEAPTPEPTTEEPPAPEPEPTTEQPPAPEPTTEPVPEPVPTTQEPQEAGPGGGNGNGTTRNGNRNGNGNRTGNGNGNGNNGGDGANGSPGPTGNG